ncbi:MAG TPA: aminotransferase class IV family protein [Xanthomonadales bacterium]|nr:aminotransferase class IV family protein [Xanthomonadales bacterium]
MSAHRIEVNGRDATREDLRRVATFNYGHFTAMQWRDGGVRGLSLHLERLDAATRALFGHPLEAALVRARLAHALHDARGSASVRVHVFSHALDRDALAAPAPPDVLVVVGPPAPAVGAPLRVRSAPYERELPAIKHAGTFGLFHQRRLAQQDGFDDALFVARDGAVSEGTTWNAGFHDGTRVVWPEAPMLDGVTQQLLRAGLAARGIAQETRRVRRDELSGFACAFATNTAMPVRAIASIDAHRYRDAGDLVATLRAIHDAVPPEAP